MFDPLRAKARIILYVAVAFLFGLGLASGFGWTGPSFAMPTVTQAPQISQEAVKPATDLSEAFANVAESVTPAVVRIEVESTRPAPTGRGIPDQFRRFFNLPDDPDMQDHPEIPSLAGGSGFVVSEDGYILTNNHVVADADAITVYFPDRRQFTAEVVGSDPTTDVAVIKIDAEDLPFMSLGSSENLRVGEWILAIGNPGVGGPPGQLDYTVTAGIVSAKGRPLQLIGSELQRESGVNPGFAIEDFIQTDAVINRGNSGGPMVNLRGQVVGINSAIVSPTGYYQGYGFAIPMDLAERVMEDLIEYGRVRRAWLGVSIEGVTPEDMEYYDLPDVAGVEIQSVTEDSPAEDAGLQPGDVLYSVDGRVVHTPNGLQNIVAQQRPGDRVELRIYRDGEARTETLRLAEAPLQPQDRPEPEPEATESQVEKLGIDVENMDAMDPSVLRQLGYEGRDGVIITSVTPLGPAARKAVQRGALLVEINDEAVETVADVERILRGVDSGEVVSLRLGYPDGSTRIANVRAGG